MSVTPPMPPADPAPALPYLKRDDPIVRFLAALARSTPSADREVHDFLWDRLMAGGAVSLKPIDPTMGRITFDRVVVAAVFRDIAKEIAG